MLRMPVARFGAAIAMTLAFGPAADAETPASRGAYLVETVMTCHNCHTPMGPNGPQMDKALSGGLTFDEPPFTVTASNITPHETGLGTWTDAQIETLLRTGVRPSGEVIAPVMPSAYYGIITKDDMAAIIAYLRSVPPVENTVPAPVYRATLPPQVFPGTEKPWSNPGATPEERGFYLASIAHCMECHTPLGPAGRDFVGRLGAGGDKFPGPWGVSVARNISSDKEHGIGAWTDEEIRRAITKGISRDGSPLMPPMGFAFYDRMTEQDLSDLIAWLRTVPPVH